MKDLLASQQQAKGHLVRRLLILLCSVAASRANSDSSSTSPPSLSASKPVHALVPPGNCQFDNIFTAVPLLQRTSVSPTSSVLRFGLPDPAQPLNLSTCACLLARIRKQQSGEEADDTEEDVFVVRPYTPISTNKLQGCFDLLVKNYGPKAPLSRHLHEMAVGETTVEFSHIDFNVKIQAPFRAKKIAMLVGGTGITPMIQALHAILGEPDDASSGRDGGSSPKNEVVMLYGSKIKEDILAKEMMDAWARDHADRFQCVHILSNEPDDSSWDGLRGYIDKERIRQYLPGPEEDVLIFVCGPPPMYDSLCGPRNQEDLTGILAELGYQKDQVYKF